MSKKLSKEFFDSLVKLANQPQKEHRIYLTRKEYNALTPEHKTLLGKPTVVKKSDVPQDKKL